MLLEQQLASYDYKTAFTNLQRKIQLLSSIKEQHQGQSSPLGRSLYFFRQHRGSLLLLFAMYSMSTASVVSAIMAEKRLQADLLQGQHEQQQLQQEIHRLQQQVQQQQELLQLLHHQQPGSSSSSSNREAWWRWLWRGSGGTNAEGRQALLDAVEQWQQQQLQQRQQLATRVVHQVAQENIGSGSSASDTTETLGVRVGKLGQGFVI